MKHLVFAALLASLSLISCTSGGPQTNAPQTCVNLGSGPQTCNSNPAATQSNQPASPTPSPTSVANASPGQPGTVATGTPSPASAAPVFTCQLADGPLCFSGIGDYEKGPMRIEAGTRTIQAEFVKTQERNPNSNSLSGSLDFSVFADALNNCSVSDPEYSFFLERCSATIVNEIGNYIGQRGFVVSQGRDYNIVVRAYGNWKFRIL